VSKEHIVKHDHGDGTHSESRITEYPSGATKEVVVDTTNRNLVSVDPVVSVTNTDSKGNSTTKRY
jgi:hypothetical protein